MENTSTLTEKLNKEFGATDVPTFVPGADLLDCQVDEKGRMIF